MKNNGFKLTKERSRKYPAQTITDVDYADDIGLLANTPAWDETRLHRLKRVATGISLYVNASKTEYMCFYQKGVIFTENGNSLKLVENFTNLGSSDSSNESDISTQLAKPW